MTTAQQLLRMSLTELAPLIASKQVSPVEVTQQVLDRIDRYNKQMRIYITITADVAMAQAKAAEAAILAGDYRGPMHGIPVSLKDNVWTKGIRTTAASLVRQDFVPTEDAGVTTRLAQAGTVLLGKANMTGLAFGDNHEEYGLPVNPWSLEHTAAGSSSGSGAGVASYMAYASVGSDTGGSIRGPAHANGVVGLKPTYGLVSRYGVLPVSWSVDHAGPLARTVSDAAHMLGAMAGYDPRDLQCANVPPVDYAAALTGDLTGVRVGFITNHPVPPSKLVAGKVAAAIDVMKGLGATIVEVELPYVEHSRHLYTAVVNPEAAVFHGDDLRDRPELFSDFVRERLDTGMLVYATQYLKAQQVRQLMVAAFQELLTKVDVLVGPGNPLPPGPQGQQKMVDIDGVEYPSRVASAGYTNVYNLTGMPALVLPCGFTDEGTTLPIGLQIAGRWFDDATVLKVADAYERSTDWHLRVPPYPEAFD